MRHSTDSVEKSEYDPFLYPGAAIEISRLREGVDWKKTLGQGGMSVVMCLCPNV